MAIDSIKVEITTCNESGIDKIDHIPLKRRFELLLATKIESVCPDDFQSETKRPKWALLLPPVDALIKMEVADEISQLQTISVENGGQCVLEAISTDCEPPVEQQLVPCNATSMHASASPASFVKVKVETLGSDSETQDENRMDNSSEGSNMAGVKGENGTCGESYEEVIDHMPLQQRMELLVAKSAFNLDSSRNLKCLRKTLPSAFPCGPSLPDKGKPEGIIRQRKRKKTATISVETALEEDAPGLLKVLVEKGVTVDEIKLYGDTESDDALDISSEDDTFGDLEDVVSKLFSQRSSFLKFAPLRSKVIIKPSYCLACLLSLIEQTRYLQFREWSVEWGWCRDLQSFIFVFEKHNRIVLERPEYGYATYFFELVDSLPIDWQIKRLVTALKLTSCSRTTLIENKALLLLGVIKLQANQALSVCYDYSFVVFI
ncbi:Nac domain-containing protein [Thalictrum thalictroides]|uniref:Nac domain-containing protein n=1 Tax=Thalictrum thalictroides TaxID=46969 RepID=A0A7J6VNQ4_THATH|nr:Nac domain-containing protein [Thalictrum thalictroides]